MMINKRNKMIHFDLRYALSIAAVILMLFPTVIVTADSNSGWGVATLIENENSGLGELPQVAVDSSGNAIAVWDQSDGFRFNIMTNRYTVGHGWGTTTFIEFDNSGDASSPQVDMDANGNAIAVWSQYAGTTYDIYANRYVVGFGWGTATLIEFDNIGDALEPQITVDNSGNATAVWRQNDGALYNIQSNRYIVGVGWGTVSLIETDNAGHADDPQVANDGSGNAIAVWTQNDGLRNNIWANRYIVGFGWGTASLIETNDTGNAEKPQVGMDEAGNTIAVWSHHNGALWNVWTNRFEVSSWGTPELLENDDAGDAQRPQVAVNDIGEAVATWQQKDGTWNNIWVSRYDIGSGWGTAMLIENENSGNAFNPKPTVDGNGNTIVVWNLWDGTRFNIWANQYDSLTGWGTASIIETENAGDAFSPEVAMDATGNAVTVWYQHDGTRFNIWANRFILPDITAPSLDLTSPTNGLTTNKSTVTVSGSTEPGVQLNVNGILVNVESDGSFGFQLALIEGENVITATATDSSDNTATDSVTVNYTIPSSNLEQELQETKDLLNDTIDELADVLDALNQTMGDLNTTNDELNQTKTELATIQTQLNELNTLIQNTENNLNTTEIELQDVQTELQSIQSELQNIQTELENIEKESEDGDQDSQDMLTLILPIIIFVILLVIMLVMYMSLTKKIANKSKPPTDLPEETPEPPTEENEEQIEE
jgi:methyl-accepting chemotaxis protein